MIHHGDKKIQQDDDIYNGVSAEHQHTPETREHFYAVELEALEIHEAEDRPEERLSCLEQAAIIHRKPWNESARLIANY